MRTGNRLTIAGLSVLAVAMVSAVALVTHYLLGQTTAIVTTVVAAAGFVLVWFALPLGHRRGPGDAVTPQTAGAEATPPRSGSDAPPQRSRP